MRPTLWAFVANFWLDERAEAGGDGGDGGKKDGEIPANITEMVNGAMAKIEGTAIPGAIKPLKDALATVTTGLAELSGSVKEMLKSQKNGADGDPPADDDPPKPEGGKGTKYDADMRALRKTVAEQGDELKTAREDREAAKKEAEAANRKSEIARLLSSLHFVDEEAAANTNDFFLSKVVTNDEGVLMVGDITLPEYITKTMDGAFAGLLKSDAGGSGQRQGTGAATGRKKSQGVQIEDIKEGMTDEAQEQAWKDVGNALPV